MDERMVGRWNVGLGGDWIGDRGSAVRCDWQDVEKIVVMARDPICGMTVDGATALRAECDGETFYFCSGHCQK